MAIAYDNGTYAQATTGTSLSFAFTVSGSDRILFVMGSDKSSAASVVTGITYNGVALTKITGLNGSGSANDRAISIWYLIAPATGSNNVVISASESVGLRFSAVSYNGVKQSSPIDVSDTSTATGSATISNDVTTSTDNDWAIQFIKDATGSLTYSSSTGDTMRLANDAGGHAIADTGSAITPAGSTTMTLGNGSSANIGGLMVAFSPSIPTNIKTVNGLVKASIKTVNGLAIASVKSINGLT